MCVNVLKKNLEHTFSFSAINKCLKIAGRKEQKEREDGLDATGEVNNVEEL